MALNPPALAAAIVAEIDRQYPGLTGDPVLRGLITQSSARIIEAAQNHRADLRALKRKATQGMAP